MLNKYQLKANKTNKKQLSTTLSTVIDGHWSAVLGSRYHECSIVLFHKEVIFGSLNHDKSKIIQGPWI